MRVAVIGWGQQTNAELTAAWRWLGLDARLLTPEEALQRLESGDVALGRLDVVQTLDGIEPGLDKLGALRERGIRLLNPPESLIRTHDKLATEAALARAGLTRPRTWRLGPDATGADLEPPLVLKPRFGSWGRDVFRCADRDELARTLDEIRTRQWFAHDGAIAQELLPTPGYDHRIVVAGSRVIGAADRVARPGEWRTNVSLGGTLRATVPSPAACELAIAVADSLGGDLIGVDLIPLEAGGFSVIEANGAVEFDERYSLAGGNVYRAAAEALALPEFAVGFPHRPAVIARMPSAPRQEMLAARRKEPR
jgi:[lysine-biosynthesis-protein LysW]--L-2-aminoadipate ligase